MEEELDALDAAASGAILMRLATVEAFQQHQTAVLDAQAAVIPFCERLGFGAECPMLLDAGIDHRRPARERRADRRGASGAYG